MARTQSLAWVILVAGLLGCSDQNRPITVGSKNFIEQVLLGEIIAQHIERRLERKVERKFNLGGTLLAHQALVKGEIDLYPEYTGTAATAILDLPPLRGGGDMLARVRSEYLRRFGIRWLEPLGFNNTFAMVIRREDARVHHLETLSDATRFPPGWTLGVGYEFQQRPDGLPQLLQTYRLPLVGPLKTMDLGLLYRALEDRQVNMIAANSTDGLLSVLEVTVLRDDQGCFPLYQAAIAVRRDSLEREPGLEQALNELGGKFTDDTMRRLNRQAVVEHGQVGEVAARFLKDSGLR